MRNHPWIAACLVLAGLPASAGQLPPRREPPLEGQRITARDGDVIVIENEDRVRMVRRRHAQVRVIADETRNLIVILADWAPASGQPDGIVDQTWRFAPAEGRWPLDARWDGPAVVEEDEWARRMPGNGLALETSSGLVIFHNGPSAPADSRGPIAVIRFQSFVAGEGRLTFDQSERQQLSDNPPSGSRASFGSPGYVSGSGSSMIWGGVAGGVSGGIPPPPPPPNPPPPGAVRVGAGIATPRKIHHVNPVMPEQAKAANVQGIVILELTIGPDGLVQDARVLRSIPPLDQAALDAARQWRFEPVLLNGQPVPVIMTATVQFMSGQ